MVLLVVGEESLGDGLSDSVDLVGGTTTSDSDSHVEILEPVSTSKENGLVHLQSEGLGFEQVEGSTVDSDVAGSLGAEGNSGGVLLSSECLDRLFLTHLQQDISRRRS